MKTQDEVVGEQIAAQIIARIDAATARPACTNPAAMTERLIDAVIYAETASGPYVRAARKEVNDARAAIEEALTAAEGRIKAEREACAQLVEDQMPATQDMESTEICEALERAAAAIRARKDHPNGQG